MRPNLFDFAPSELSQDAFLCWLLAYADPLHASDRPAIHALGREFLALMFAKDASAPPPTSIQSVRVQRQVEGIDILCVVNGTIAVVIEDKVGTTEHSGQLDAYSEVVKKLGYDQVGKRIVRIYLQTGNQGSYKRVRDSGYHVVSRLDVLGLLEGAAGVAARGGSDIVDAFYVRLSRIETQVQSFCTAALDSWSAEARMGFYMALQEVFPEANWRYVANPGGGLYAFFWHGGEEGEDGCEPYLQIEAEKGRLDLRIRISTPAGSNASDLRTRWQKKVLAGGAQLGIPVQRPLRNGTGATMTVALFGGFPCIGAGGVVDVAKSIEVIRRAEGLLKACIAAPARTNASPTSAEAVAT